MESLSNNTNNPNSFLEISANTIGDLTSICAFTNSLKLLTSLAFPFGISGAFLTSTIMSP